jgi:hypothetical protein
MAGGVAGGDRPRPAYGGVNSAKWAFARLADYPAADRLSDRQGDGARAPAPRRLRLQAAHLDAGSQGGGAAAAGEKRLKVGALLVATTAPSPPLPLAALLPDPSVGLLQAPDDPLRTELLALRRGQTCTCKTRCRSRSIR